MEPKISFIIATRNRADVIKDTLQSIIDQTIPDWEAIIVNDHGHDNTEEVVNSFSDSRFKYYNLPDDNGSGASCARNFAAVMACAPIIAIMDSDDICYPNRVEVTLNSFEENPDADIFYGNIDVWEEETNEIRERKTPFTEYSFEKIKAGNFITHPTVAIKKEILLDNPYNQFFRIAEDYELFSRLAKSGKKFIWSKEKILKYRIHADNISVGAGKDKKVRAYGYIARMIRGWADSDISKLEDIKG